jgi:hypothetical protein
MGLIEIAAFVGASAESTVRALTASIDKGFDCKSTCWQFLGTMIAYM